MEEREADCVEQSRVGVEYIYLHTHISTEYHKLHT